MKYSTLFILIILNINYASNLEYKITFSSNMNKYCPEGKYAINKTSSINLICDKCIDATPLHKITFWSNMIMIFVIFDIIWIQIFTNERLTKQLIYYSFFLLFTITIISCNIMNCIKPVSTLLIKEYMIISYALFVFYLIWQINNFMNNRNTINI